MYPAAPVGAIGLPAGISVRIVPFRASTRIVGSLCQFVRRNVVGYEVSFFSHVLNFVIILLGLLMILTILIQRGKGGGLIGAFGGAGGSSPFGSKAGDTFTRITITMAGIWVLLIMIHIKVAKSDTHDNTATKPEITRTG